MFITYVMTALYEMKAEKKNQLSASAPNNELTKNVSDNEMDMKINGKEFRGREPKTKKSATSTAASKSESNLAEVREDLQHMAIRFDKQMLKVISTFVGGTVGILIGAEPFIHSLEGFSRYWHISSYSSGNN